jgi:hypothetical protein
MGIFCSYCYNAATNNMNASHEDSHGSSKKKDDGWKTIDVLPSKTKDDGWKTIDVVPSKTKDDGWKTIDVFYGKTQLPEDNPNQRWYSQVGQDEIVMALLNNKQGGYFIELAANDALTLSNSYSLERYGQWKGLCIEPNPMYWHDLSRYRTCQMVAAIVGDKRMEGK